MDLLPTVIKKQFDPHLYSAYGEALSTSSSVQLNDRMFPQFVGGMQNYNNLSYDSSNSSFLTLGSFFSNYFKCSPMEDVLLKRKRQLELIDQKVKETNCKIERINCEFRRDVRKLLDFNKNKILNDSLSKEKSVSELLEEISKYKDTSYFMREMPLSSLFEFKIPNNVKKVRTLVDHEPSSLLLSETPTPDTTLFVLNKGILQPDYPMMNRMKKKVNQCPHKDAKHYAKVRIQINF